MTPFPAVSLSKPASTFLSRFFWPLSLFHDVTRPLLVCPGSIEAGVWNSSALGGKRSDLKFGATRKQSHRFKLPAKGKTATVKNKRGVESRLKDGCRVRQRMGATRYTYGRKASVNLARVTSGGSKGYYSCIVDRNQTPRLL